jgi:hypothetical protein
MRISLLSSRSWRFWNDCSWSWTEELSLAAFAGRVDGRKKMAALMLPVRASKRWALERVTDLLISRVHDCVRIRPRY